jgi:hypothetical protein
MKAERNAYVLAFASEVPIARERFGRRRDRKGGRAPSITCRNYGPKIWIEIEMAMKVYERRSHCLSTRLRSNAAQEICHFPNTTPEYIGVGRYLG